MNKQNKQSKQMTLLTPPPVSHIGPPDHNSPDWDLPEFNWTIPEMDWGIELPTWELPVMEWDEIEIPDWDKLLKDLPAWDETL